METRMNMRQSFWKEAVAPQGKENARRTKNVARKEAKRGNAGTGEHQIAAGLTEKAGRCLRQGRGRKFSEGVSEDALRD